MLLTVHKYDNLVMKAVNCTFHILTDLNLISGIASAIFVWLPWIVAIYILCRRVRMKVLQSPYSRLRSTNNGKYCISLSWHKTCIMKRDLVRNIYFLSINSRNAKTLLFKVNGTLNPTITKRNSLNNPKYISKAFFVILM